MQESKKLGFFSLFAMGLGYIIGGALFGMLPIVMGYTGKSISLACLAGAVLCTFATCIPAIFVSSVVDLPGGIYSQGAVLLPKMLVGANGIFNILGLITFAGSVISMTGYLVQLFPGLADSQKLVSFILLIAFFLLGVKGVKLSAGFQNITVIILVLALATFAVGGLPKVDFGNYFSDNFFSGGASGFLYASSMMVFCSLGGTTVLAFTSEAKNPKRTIPLAILRSTLAVAVIYCLIAVVGSGILPVEEVAGSMNLGIVAETFLSKPLYLFFMIGGAMFGLGTTVNSTLASLPYPILQMAKDGWFPAVCTKRDKKFNYPYVIMGFAFAIGGVLPIAFGLNISDIASLAGVGVFLFAGIMALAAMQLPKRFPGRWKKSAFHIPDMFLYILLAVSAFSAFFLTFQMLKMNGLKVSLVIAGLFVIVLAYCFWRVKTGKVDISYIKIEDNNE